MSFNHRRKARILMCQALYQQLMTGHSSLEIMQQFIADNQEKKYDKAYFNTHLPQIFEHLAELDELLQTVLVDKQVSEITPVELSVCRFGVYELYKVSEVPFKVVISEALHIEQRFGTEDGHKFVNGVLDQLASRLRQGEVQKN